MATEGLAISGGVRSFEGGVLEGGRIIDDTKCWRFLGSIRGRVPLQAASLNLQSQLAGVCVSCSPIWSHSGQQGVGPGPDVTLVVTKLNSTAKTGGVRELGVCTQVTKH